MRFIYVLFLKLLTSLCYIIRGSLLYCSLLLLLGLKGTILIVPILLGYIYVLNPVMNSLNLFGHNFFCVLIVIFISFLSGSQY